MNRRFRAAYGCTPHGYLQRRCLARLDELPAQVLEAGICSPALVVVGRVVELAPELDWFRPDEEPAPAASADLPRRVARA